MTKKPAGFIPTGFFYALRSGVSICELLGAVSGALPKHIKHQLAAKVG
ncbi:MAG: hypothetical protein ACTIJ4_17130 [Halomonas sp.]